jgi:hypothetical protein
MALAQIAWIDSSQNSDSFGGTLDIDLDTFWLCFPCT